MHYLSFVNVCNYCTYHKVHLHYIIKEFKYQISRRLTSQQRGPVPLPGGGGSYLCPGPGGSGRAGVRGCGESRSYVRQQPANHFHCMLLDPWTGTGTPSSQNGVYFVHI